MQTSVQKLDQDVNSISLTESSIKEMFSNVTLEWKSILNHQ